MYGSDVEFLTVVVVWISLVFAVAGLVEWIANLKR